MTINVTCEQWVFTFEVNGGGEDFTCDASGYEFYNPDPDNESLRRFYEVVSGRFGAPMINAEPSLSIECPQGFDYVTASGEATTADERIAGFICVEDGKIVHRASLTNWVVFQKKEFKLTEESTFLVGDREWSLARILRKDKNRIFGFDVVLVPLGTNTDLPVTILELEDLAVMAISA